MLKMLISPRSKSRPSISATRPICWWVRAATSPLRSAPTASSWWTAIRAALRQDQGRHRKNLAAADQILDQHSLASRSRRRERAVQQGRRDHRGTRQSPDPARRRHDQPLQRKQDAAGTGGRPPNHDPSGRRHESRSRRARRRAQARDQPPYPRRPLGPFPPPPTPPPPPHPPPQPPHPPLHQPP